MSRMTLVATTPSPRSSTSCGSSSSARSFTFCPRLRSARSTDPPVTFQTSLPSFWRTLPVMPGSTTTTSRMAFFAIASDGQRCLPPEPRNTGARAEEIGALGRRHLGADRLPEHPVAPFPLAVVPDSEQRLSEEPVTVSVERELVVLAPRDENDARADVHFL